MLKRLFLIALLAPVAAVQGAELAVGLGKPFARIEEAMAKAQPGDTILVHPLPDNKPYEKPALYVTKPRLTIRSAAPAGQRVKLSGEGFDYSGRGSIPRAIVQFNKGADGCVLEGFELTGAHNDSNNGAGVRINQANDVIVRNCHIHDNDMGIMSNGDGTQQFGVNQLIEGCLIHSNGSLKDPGYNHNLYLGGTSVRLLGCEIHSSLTGHNVKSRAHHTIVQGCYIHDSSNREFDLVDARDTAAPESHAWIVGCTIVKNPRCPGNRAVIHFGRDGNSEHNGTLYVAHNTIITPFIAPVVTLSTRQARAELYNNIVWDGASRQGGMRLVDASVPGDPKRSVTGRCNWLSAGLQSPTLADAGLEQTTIGQPGATPPFADPAKRDYRLARPDPAFVDAGAAIPPAVGEVFEYRPPAAHAKRPVRGKPDLGAYERAD